jgi:hypothetical protein
MMPRQRGHRAAGPLVQEVVALGDDPADTCPRRSRQQVVGAQAYPPGESKPGNRVEPRANAGREGTPVFTVVKSDDATPSTAPEPAAAGVSLIDEIVRDGPRRMLAAALEAEVAAYAGQLDERGRRRAMAVPA